MTEAKTGLYAALAKFQAELPEVTKGQEAKVKDAKTGQEKYSYKYADLADVNRVALRKLGQHDLAFLSKPTLIDGQFVLAYSLVHVSGEREDGVYPLGQGTPQQLGGLITYARRYAFCAVTGIAPEGDDDDGQAAQRAAEQDWRHPPPRPPGDLPRNSDGSLSRSRATDAELAAAGAMTSTQLKEHTALRKGAVTGKTAGTVERIRGPAPDDQWTVEAEIPQDGQPEDGTDEKWYSQIVQDAVTFKTQDESNVLRRRISEKVDALGCTEGDAATLRALIREHQRELATGGGGDAA